MSGIARTPLRVGQTRRPTLRLRFCSCPTLPELNPLGKLQNHVYYVLSHFQALFVPPYVSHHSKEGQGNYASMMPSQNINKSIILAILYVVLAVYGFQAFRTLFKSPLMHWAYIILFLGALVFLTIKVMTYDPGDGFKGTAAIAGTIFASFFFFDRFFAIFHLATFTFKRQLILRISLKMFIF